MKILCSIIGSDRNSRTANLCSFVQLMRGLIWGHPRYARVPASVLSVQGWPGDAGGCTSSSKTVPHYIIPLWGFTFRNIGQGWCLNMLAMRLLWWVRLSSFWILLFDLFRAFSRSEAYNNVELEIPTWLAILGIRLKGPNEQKALTSRIKISPSSVTLNIYLFVIKWLCSILYFLQCMKTTIEMTAFSKYQLCKQCSFYLSCRG